MGDPTPPRSAYDLSAGDERAVLWNSVDVSAIDVTAETFDRDVIERSHELPVVVDFWASWCGPCLRLGPVLEREADARGGEVVLAKVDVDANQELALRYDVSGIPAVKAFRNGQVVREFVGAVPPTVVTDFLDALTGPSATEKVKSELQATGELPDVVAALEQQDYERALELLLGEIASAEDGRRRRLVTLTVDLFGELGPEHPVAAQYRKRLAAMLY
jgi:putative thioredoxin